MHDLSVTSEHSLVQDSFKVFTWPHLQLQHFSARSKSDFATSSSVVCHQEELQKTNTLNPAFSICAFFFPLNKTSQKTKFEPLQRTWIIILILRGNESDHRLTLHISHHVWYSRVCLQIPFSTSHQQLAHLISMHDYKNPKLAHFLAGLTYCYLWLFQSCIFMSF